MTPFTCTTSTVGDTRVLTVTGDVDLATHDRLVEAGTRPLADGGRLVLDCAQIAFLDSRGLTALLELRRHAADSGAEFALASVPPSVARVLELSGTGALFPVVDRPSEARELLIDRVPPVAADLAAA